MKDRSGKITIEFYCDEAGEDVFRFQILTGLTDKDVGKLKERTKRYQKKWP